VGERGVDHFLTNKERGEKEGEINAASDEKLEYRLLNTVSISGQ
jgi:hypothetical protein